MLVKDYLIDTWASWSHKNALSPGVEEGTSRLAPTWVPAHSTRRLTAYKLCASYLENVARYQLQDAKRQRDSREYGDPGLLRDQVRAAVIGDGWTISVRDAQHEPVEPTPPEPLDETTATDDERAAFADARAEYDAEKVIYDRKKAEYEAARERQEWFEEWADDEKWGKTVVETENDAVGLGDGVYYFAWSNRKRRVVVESYDPGFFFPVFTDDDDPEFPSKIHLAWQYEDNDDPGKCYVRRKTWELRPVLGDDGQPTTPATTLPYGDEMPMPVMLPGNTEPVEAVFRCYMTDATWPLDHLGALKVDTWDLSNAEINRNDIGQELIDYDLGIDYIPLVHIPNTVEPGPWGKSIFARPAQALDDIVAADTDLNLTSAITGSPPITISGASPAGGSGVGQRAYDTSVGGEEATLRAGMGRPRPQSGADLTSYGPGQVFWTGQGKMDVLDTSSSLDALLKYQSSLRDIVSIITRVPKEILGRVNLKEAPSGFAILLGFAPFRSLVADLRLPREDKYRLCYKMVQRLAMVGGKDRGGLAPGPVMTTDMAFGSYIPADMKGIVDMVVALLQAKGISRPTAIAMLREAGLPIDDVGEEVDAVQHADFEGAGLLADALGDEGAAYEYLGRPQPAEPVQPAPGTPGAPPIVPAPPGATGAPGQPPVPGQPPAPQPPPVPGSRRGAPQPSGGQAGA